MYQVYQIKPGDTLETIANKFNTNTKTIKEINRINYSLNLVPGDYIVVPTINDDRFQTYIVKKGDNMYEIAREYNVNYNDLLQINGLKDNEYIYPDQEILVPSKGTKIYVTKDGDTISFVLNAFEVDPEELLKQNKNIYLQKEQLISYKKEEFM